MTTKGKAVKKDTVRVSAKLYKSATGELPAGDRRWVFRDVGGANLYEVSGPYAKAKKSAVTMAAARGVFDIEVMP